MENPGCELDLGWINSVSVNGWCVSDEVKDLPEQTHILQGVYRAAWLLKAVSCIDLTTLSGDDTCSSVTRLCLKAANPIASKILRELHFTVQPFATAAVCVYPARVRNVVDAVTQLSLQNVLPVAAVATGFPSGQYKLESRLLEIRNCVADGATEIDIVIDRSLVLSGQWELLYQELQQMKEACGNCKMKTILAVGELGDFRNIYKASLVSMMAGSDFIKTSTGKEVVNATLPVGLVMMRAIQDYYKRTTYKVGFKAAGGVKTARDALNWLILAKKKLGNEWLNKSLFRIGASGLLADLEKELFILAFGKTPAKNEFTLGPVVKPVTQVIGLEEKFQHTIPAAGWRGQFEDIGILKLVRNDKLKTSGNSIYGDSSRIFQCVLKNIMHLRPAETWSFMPLIALPSCVIFIHFLFL